MIQQQFLETLGGSIRREQDAVLAKESLETVQQQLGELGKAPIRASKRVGWTLAAAAVVLVALGSAIYLERPRAIPFAVKWPATAQQTSGRLGAWVSAPKDAAVPIVFADGTHVTVGTEARMRIARSDTEIVSIIVERGNLAFSVVHHPGTRWSIATGPFDVTVTGTEFDVRWHPELETLEVAVRRGSVVVSGCQFVSGKDVKTNEVLRARCGDTLSVTTTERADLNEPLVGQAPSVSPEDILAKRPVDRASRDVAQEPALAAPKWQTFARKGQYRTAYEIVDRAGFEATSARASAADLLLLVDVARYSGQSGRAESAALLLRSHYPNQPQAALAAFTLGRLAFDQAHDYSAAAKWFGTYLKEQPGGALSREAEGRLMECLSRSGQARQAQEAAERYLAKYPEGPHARLAHTLLGSSR